MEIHFLADHEEAIPIIARWYYNEWSHIHPGKTLDEVERAIAGRINKKSLPLALVALEGNELIGTVCLKISDMDIRKNLAPWLAGLYVVEEWRRKGIGTLLVREIEQKAIEQGIRKLFLYTPDAVGFYARSGWKVREKIVYKTLPVTIMDKEIS